VASLTIVTLCTGNASRSVMSAMMLAQLADHEGISLNILSAGTHVIDGQPMGARTRAALASLGDVDISTVPLHRSHQLSPGDVAKADLILAMEADHIRYVRRVHPEAANKTVTLIRFVRELSPDDRPVTERLAAMSLGSLSLDDEQDVEDPAGGDQEVYNACAQELWELCQVAIAMMGSGSLD